MVAILPTYDLKESMGEFLLLEAHWRVLEVVGGLDWQRRK